MKFEEIEVGSEIPTLTKMPTTRQLVMWAGASGDYNPIHYDQDLARRRGLDGVIVPGQLVTAFLGQLLARWMGEQGRLKKLSASFKGMSCPGQTIACRGRVTRKAAEGHLVELAVWAENSQGEKTVSGTAVVELVDGT